MTSLASKALRPSGLTTPYRGKARLLNTELVLPRPIDEVFDFFSDARNLETITPPFLRFRLTTPAPVEMRTGAIINYRLSLRGVPIRWRTRITAWDPPHRFIDVQERGPYRLWHHEHIFEPTPDGGTRCRDVVHYAHRAGPILERCLIRPDIERIFAFRTRALSDRFSART